MTPDRMKLSAQTVRDNIAILEEIKEPDDAGYYLQLEHEKFVLGCIEKQIPKKVELYTNDGNFKWQNYPCPCCKEMLGLNVNKRYVKFCQNCGQALDWSDTE